MSQFNSAIPARKPTSIILGSWLLALLCCPLASSKTQTENAIEFPVETREYTLTVVDEDGKPIAGAAVEAAGVRCQEHPGSWYGWPAINIGKTNRLFSDATGKITVRYPVKYGRPPEWLTTTTLDFRFKHPLYVANSIEVDPREEGIEHVMIWGVKSCYLLWMTQDCRSIDLALQWRDLADKRIGFQKTERFRRVAFPTAPGKPCSSPRDPLEFTCSVEFYPPSSRGTVQ